MQDFLGERLRRCIRGVANSPHSALRLRHSKLNTAFHTAGHTHLLLLGVVFNRENDRVGGG